MVLATPLYPPQPGGPATYAKTLFEGLPKEGIEVVLVKFSEVRHLPRFVRHLAYYRRVLAAAKNADAIFALDPISVGVPAMHAAHKLKKPFFVKIVGDYAWEQGSQRYGVTGPLDMFVRTKQTSLRVRLLQRAQTKVARAAQKIIVPSQYLRGIVSAWGIPEERIQVIYNSVSVDAVTPPINRPNGFLVVSAGREVPWKGFEALQKVVATEPSWHLFIASSLPREDTLGWIQAADVFVLNSSYEGLSHLLIEAMRLGTPIVATEVGGNLELIENGKTGLLIPSQNNEQLHAALKEVEAHRDTAKVRAEAAKAVAARFSPQNMLAETAAFFRKEI